MKRLAAILLIAALASGCANRVLINPHAVDVGAGLLVDGKFTNRAQVIADGRECYSIAESTNPGARTAGSAIAGAIVGALLGALIYRSAGLSGNRGAGFGAGYGALGGVSGGGVAAMNDFKTVLRNCMSGRGHLTLN